MRSLRLAWLTLKNLLAESPMMRVAAIAITLVPLLYGALYLWAFWDPYGKLDQLPIALVNEDVPVTVDGTLYHSGKDLTKKLLDGHDVGWQQVSSAEATAGLKSRRFYLELLIPADFSAKLATAKSDDPQRAGLKVVAQESSNMLASQIMSRVLSEVRSGAGEAASKTYFDLMFSGFSDAHDGLKDAEKGAKDLRDGLKTARSGAHDVAAGATTADDGAHDLADGLGTLNSGARDANAGAWTLSANMRKLAAGLVTARAGAERLAGGASELATGLASADAGAQSVAGGSAALATGLRTAEGGAKQVAGGLTQLSAGSGQLTGSLDSLATGANTLANSGAQLSAGAASLKSGLGSALGKLADADTGAKQVAGGASSVAAALHAYADANPAAANDPTFAGALAGAEQVKSGSKDLADGLDSAKAGAPTLAAGAGQVADGASALSAGLAKLAAGADKAHAGSAQLSAAAGQLDGGASSLAQGVSAASSGAGSLADGSSKLAAGTSSLAAGAKRVASGASALSAGSVAAGSGSAQLAVGSIALATGTRALASGASDAKAGADTLANGVAQLDDGAHQLATGLWPAQSGAEDLRSALASGAAGVPNYDTALRDRNTDMMSNPVALTTKRQGEVPTYGTGFTPYFVPLALWVGALLAFFIMRPLSGRALAAGANPVVTTLASYLPAALFGIAQAVVLMAVVQFGLGLKPVNVWATYAYAILVALVYMAILQMLNGAFGAVGKLLSIVFLMLQLTSAGGTFPTQMIPGFFQTVNAWMPMSYAVVGLRQTVSGGDMATAWQTALAVLAFGLVALAGTAMAAWRKQSWTMERLHPSLSL